MNIKNLLTVVLLTLATGVTAQLKVGNNPTTINANSVLEVESTNKGLLLPRVALTGTASFAPLSANVAGMAVYNTATAGDVTPGYYYNNGTSWQRLLDQSSTIVSTATNGLTAASGNVKLGGALIEPTTISGLTATNKLSITGTGVDAFSVDGNTLSVDATNNRVGFGVATPLSTSHVRGTQRIDGYIGLNDPTGTSQAGWIQTTSEGVGSNGISLVATQGNGKINFFTDQGAGTREVMRLTNTGRLGIGTTTPSQILSLGGTLARTINVERDTTTNSAGENLTLLAGGATIAATDKNGGNLVLSSGIATGTGSSNISFATATAGAAGTADRSASTKMIILGNGNVGIGTTNPTNSLHIIQNGATSNIVTPNYAKGITVTSNSPYGTFEGPGMYIENTAANTNSKVFKLANQLNPSGDGTLVLQATTDNTSSFIKSLFSVNSITGNVGIGTDVPSTNLDVVGQVKISGGAPGVGKVLTSDAAGLATWQTPSSTDSTIYKSNGLLTSNRSVFMGANTLAFDTSTLFINPTTNRVGIGTTSPLELLHVDKGNIKLGGNTSENKYPLLNIHTNYNADTTGGRITFTENSGTTGSFIQHNSNPGPIWGFDGLSFGAFNAAIPINPAKSAIFFSNLSTSRNFVGLGTSSPQQQLHFDGGSDNNINVAPTAAQTGNDVVFTSTGNVGIGTTNPSQKLTVENGSINVNGEGTSITIDAAGQTRFGFVKKSGDEPVIAAGSAIPLDLGHWSTTNINGNITSGTFRKDLSIEAGGNVAVTNQIKISGGSPGDGKVLTSDAAGLATWQTNPNMLHAFIGIGDVAAGSTNGTAVNVFASSPGVNFSTRSVSGNRTTFSMSFPAGWTTNTTYIVNLTYDSDNPSSSTAEGYTRSLAVPATYSKTSGQLSIILAETTNTVQDMNLMITVTKF